MRLGTGEGGLLRRPPSGDETTPLSQGGLDSRFDFGRGLDGGDLGGGTPPPSYVVGSDSPTLQFVLYVLHPTHQHTE